MRTNRFDTYLKLTTPPVWPHNRSAAAASAANEMFVAVGQAKRFRTMGHLVLNSEQWAWMIICAAWIGTAALLLTCWMRQEAPKPHPWLISPPTAPVSLSDIDIESGISAHVLGSGRASREKVRMKSRIADFGAATSHERLVAGTANTTTSKAPVVAAKSSVHSATAS